MNFETNTAALVRIAHFTDEARWNGYVDRHPDACVYHRWAWGEIFHRAYGMKSFPLIAEREGRVTGLLPLVELARGPFRPQIVSLPYFAHGGAIADDEASYRALLAAATRVARERGAQHVELRHAHAVPGSLPARDDKVLMVMDLPDAVDALEKRVGSKVRADVRRPQKEGMTTEIGGRELVRDFHATYAAVMRDLGSPCHSAELFDEAARRFEERMFVARVLYQGRTVGAAFLIGQGDTLEVPCAGTLHALNKLRPNMLLYWAIFGAAIERGYKRFSFGRSTVDAGTYTFKKNWGASPIPLRYEYILRDGVELPHAHGENPLLARVSQAWMQLPLPVTTIIGPRLVRHLA
jgi:FemAB-related protein (PEP-CTERM system-associated)